MKTELMNTNGMMIFDDLDASWRLMSLKRNTKWNKILFSFCSTSCRFNYMGFHTGTWLKIKRSIYRMNSFVNCQRFLFHKVCQVRRVEITCYLLASNTALLGDGVGWGGLQFAIIASSSNQKSIPLCVEEIQS